MYLEHFKLTDLPFGLTPDVDFFCNLKGHEEALNVILYSLNTGEGFIKITGEVGSGKTLLCRKILKTLDSEQYHQAYIPNPGLTPIELRKALAYELGMDLSKLQDQHEILLKINDKLLEINKSGKQVVLLIDEAQALSFETLEAIRLLTNLETEKHKLLQVILFGQPELDEMLSKRNLRQLKQRITFSYSLPLMTREELDSYLFHRLAVVGCNTSSLFSKRAKDLVYKSSNGIPRLVNILCHKAMLAAYGKGMNRITPKVMNIATSDGSAISFRNTTTLTIYIFLVGVLAVSIVTLCILEGLI